VEERLVGCAVWWYFLKVGNALASWFFFEGGIALSFLFYC